MGKLPPSILVNKILLPGTHNSCAYEVNFRNLERAYSSFWLMNLMGRHFPCVGFFIRNWAICQSLNIYEQLLQGVRFLDFRVSYSPQEDVFYTSHTYSCILLSDTLTQLSKFLDNYASEVVVVSMKPDWAHRSSILGKERQLLGVVLHHLGRYSFPFDQSSPNFCDVTLEKMVRNNQRALIFYLPNQDETFHWCATELVWPGSMVCEKWDDTSDIALKINCLNMHLECTEYSAVSLNVLPFTLTPQASDIKKSIFEKLSCFCLEKKKSTSLRTMASHMHSVGNSFLIEYSCQLTKFSVITCDFVEESDFIAQIINENYRRIR